MPSFCATFCVRRLVGHYFPSVPANLLTSSQFLGRQFGRPYVLHVMFFFFFFIRRTTSELRRPIAVTLCHMIAIWVFFITQVQKCEIGGQKDAKFGAISDNFRRRSKISPERDKLSKIGKTCDDQRVLPHSQKKQR